MTILESDAPEFEIAREACQLIDTLPDAKRRQVMALLVTRYGYDPKDLLPFKSRGFVANRRFKPRG